MARHSDKVIPVVTASQILRAYLLTCITLSAALCLVWVVVVLYAVLIGGGAHGGGLGYLVWVVIAPIAAFAPLIGLVLLLSFPGFLLLRGLLQLLPRHDSLSFAAMGAVNGIGLFALMDGRNPFAAPQAWPLFLTFAGLGAAAGGFQWRTERRMGQRAAASHLAEAP